MAFAGTGSLLGAAPIVSCPAVNPADSGRDVYGGNVGVRGTATGVWHFEIICNRWTFVTPAGNAAFVRAVSAVNDVPGSGRGGFQPYDAVYLQSAALGANPENFAAKAADTHPADVIHSNGVTLSAVGDAILFGSQQKPGFSHFVLSQLATGGEITWYYSKADGSWGLVNGTGKPFAATTLNALASYAMDVGNFYDTDSAGYETIRSPRSNVVTWFNLAAKTFPADFAKAALPNDATPRYYIRGVVTKAFTVPPKLSRLYERGTLRELISKKYADGKTNFSVLWAEDISRKLKGWGFNAAGMYSSRYETVETKVTTRLPTETVWQLSGHAMRTDYPYKIRSLYAGLKCPPGPNGVLRTQGMQPDFFDPAYATALKQEAAGYQAARPLSPWTFALIPEEADSLYGINRTSHDHIGYVIMAGDVYKGNKLYAKLKLRDYLRYRFRATGDPIAAFSVDGAPPAYSYAPGVPTGFEAQALAKMNQSWGTSYTTWSTSEPDGENLGKTQWGTGSGFLDEDGSHLLAKDGAGNFVCTLSYADKPFRNLNIQGDLDRFTEVFANKYGRVLLAALAPIPKRPPVLLPLYSAPNFVYTALRPYVDGFWVNAPPTDFKRIYEAAKLPIMNSDYQKSDLDSPATTRGTVSMVTYDAPSNRTRIRAPGFMGSYSRPWYVGFPGVPACNGLPAVPSVVRADWEDMYVAGNYTPCVPTGVEMVKTTAGGPVGLKTQGDRAAGKIYLLNSTLNVKGTDGRYPLVGWEHWGLYDSDVYSGTELENLGLMTGHGNAYDGIEARTAVGVDGSGITYGGEVKDYGDLLGPLGGYLKGIDTSLSYQ